MSEKNPGEETKRGVGARIRNGGIGLAALIVMMLWLSGTFVSKVGPESAYSETAAGATTTGVKTVKVARETFPLLVEQVGSIRSKSEAQVSSQLMAQVRQIRVDPGDWVKGPENGGAPTVLATLDDRAVEAKLQQARSQVVATGDALDAARANMEKAEADYRRYENLLKNGAATAQRAQYARTQRAVASKEAARMAAQKKQAEAAEREAKVMLGYTVISAPFTGRIVKKLLDVGEMAAPGRPVFFMDAPSRAEAHAVVSESLLPDLKVGQEIEVSIEDIHRKVKGRIREIVPQADDSTRTVVVKITLPASSDLVNGLFAKVYVPCGAYQALVIPAAAVREVGELHLVDAVDSQGRLERRFVRPGRTRGKFIEVLSGLKAGEEVVVP